MTKVYKILSRAEWADAEAKGVFAGSALDLKDGYIHLSTAAQAGETARLHFKGRRARPVEAGCGASRPGDQVGAVPWRPAFPAPLRGA